MALYNKEKTATGTIVNRVTWTPKDDGTVRQYWETHTYKQKEWQNAFDGIYKKVKK